MKNSNIIINDAKDIKYKLKEFEYSIKKISNSRMIALSIFLIIIALDIYFSMTYMYSDPIYPPVCAIVFVSDFIFTFIFIALSRNKEKKLLKEINEYNEKIQQYYNNRES